MPNREPRRTKRSNEHETSRHPRKPAILQPKPLPPPNNRHRPHNSTPRRTTQSNPAAAARQYPAAPAHRAKSPPQPAAPRHPHQQRHAEQRERSKAQNHSPPCHHRPGQHIRHPQPHITPAPRVPSSPRPPNWCSQNPRSVYAGTVVSTTSRTQLHAIPRSTQSALPSHNHPQADPPSPQTHQLAASAVFVVASVDPSPNRIPPSSFRAASTPGIKSVEIPSASSLDHSPPSARPLPPTSPANDRRRLVVAFLLIP